MSSYEVVTLAKQNPLVHVDVRGFSNGLYISCYRRSLSLSKFQILHTLDINRIEPKLKLNRKLHQSKYVIV